MGVVLVLMGVCGCGKTTIGKQLQERTKGIFFDGDSFHPPENVEKMKSGIPLTDSDRWAWLDSLSQIIRERVNQPFPTYIACSALKEVYRQRLLSNVSSHVFFVHLHGDKMLLQTRLENRVKEGHFMGPKMLSSQLEILEIPTDTLTIDVQQPVNEICDEIIQHFNLNEIKLI
jgi:carbohydrate kinase (thermoresistant glucokinase family)